MAELTPKLKKVLTDAGMDGSACWKHKQSGKWIVYHWACERIASCYGITFAVPTILEADAEKSVAMLVTGYLGDREEWSIGEATPTNNKNPYPYAMAEKRAKDRVILKLVDLHGEAFSEEEADDFKRPPDLSIHEDANTPKIKTQKGGDGLPLNEQEWKAWGTDIVAKMNGASGKGALKMIWSEASDTFNACPSRKLKDALQDTYDGRMQVFNTPTDPDRPRDELSELDAG